MKCARSILSLLISTAAFAAAGQVMAQQIVYEHVVENTEQTVQASDPSGANRLIEPAAVPMPAIPSGIAKFGPFRVLSATHAALVDATGTRTPLQFSAMLQAYPGINTIEMIECPGTEDDRANLQLGRMIHDRGIATHVPAGGSVRSGGVELYVAGVKRSADNGSEFAVHSWLDDNGKQAKDFSPEAPENRIYLNYYRAMGMSERSARAFYDMTNSTPHGDARWMAPEEMDRWMHFDESVRSAPYLAAAELDSPLSVN